MTNSAVSRVLSLVGDLLELKGGEDAAKAMTYRRAARSIETSREEMSDLHRQGRLQELAGVGEALAKKIAELVETGRLAYFERLSAEVPSSVLDLLRVPGIGPKTAGRLWRELGVTNIDQLEETARSGAVRRLSGLGPKKEETILAGIAAFRRTAGQVPLGLARPVGEALAQAVAALPEVVRASVAGSVRRWRDTVRNVNLVVAASDPEAAARGFAGLPEVREVTGRESDRLTAVLHYGLTVDARFVPPDRFWTALNWFTGPPDHNARLQERACALGLATDGHGLLGAEGKPLPARSEEDVYGALGLDFIPPELREGPGEMGALPRLVEPADIRGDLHVHSDWSDGQDSLPELATAAGALGYEYLAVSDHTQFLAMARGLDEKRLLAQREAIDALNASGEAAGEGAGEGRCRLLAGVEVDVLAGGELDLPDAALAELDIVTASIHSGLRRPAEETTRRLVAAAENPHVDVIGHPSGRLIGRREPSDLDLDALLAAAAQHKTILEINASPDRLDLCDADARRAKEAGCLLAVSTDAHTVRALGDMTYGVATARRAWLGPDDVANTRPLAELRKLLGKRR